MAKLAEKAKRYKEMVFYMEKVVHSLSDGEDLTVEESRLLSVAYKNVIRSELVIWGWRKLYFIEKEEESNGNADNVNIIQEYRRKIGLELSSICEGIINMLEKKLIPSAAHGDTKELYSGMQRDYQEYLANFKAVAERKEATENTLTAYRSAQAGVEAAEGGAPSLPRELSVYMAKLAEQAKRYEEMVFFMDKVVDTLSGEDLTAEERNLLYEAYRYVISARCISWDMLSSVEEEEELRGNADHLNIIKKYRGQIELELSSMCGRIIKLINEKLIRVAASGEPQVFYFEKLGDFHRYLAVFKTGAERKKALKKTLSFYKTAKKIATVKLPLIHPTRLGLLLKISVFIMMR